MSTCAIEVEPNLNTSIFYGVSNAGMTQITRVNRERVGLVAQMSVLNQFQVSDWESKNEKRCDA